MSVRLRKNDRVQVISGKDKGREGKIMRRFPARDMGPSQKSPQAGIVKQEAPIYAAKVMLVCPQCGKATRVGSSFLESGKKVRVCKKCGEIIDRA